MKGVDQPESASTLGGVRCRTRVVLTHTLTLSFSHRGDLSRVMPRFKNIEILLSPIEHLTSLWSWEGPS